MGERFKEVARWLMLATLVVAPWAFGGTRSWTIDLLNILVGIVMVLWISGAALARTWPKAPPTLVALSLLLIGYAWWMAANAKFGYDSTTSTFLPRDAIAPNAPGSIDYDLSLALAQRVSALLAAVCFLCEMGQSNLWRKRLVWTMAVTGLSIALFGLVQRGLSAPSILWQGEDSGGTFFATYRYHSNAGSFLNLVWPLMAVRWVNSWRRRESWRATLLWGAAVLVCFCGLMVSGARAASAITLFLVLLWAVWIGWQMRRDELPAPTSPTVIVGTGLLLLLIVAVAGIAGLEVTARRWAKVEELFSTTNPRLLVDLICCRMIPEAGWFGFGPGTFRVAFPYFTRELGDSVVGIWRYAHQDFLQTFVEWGYIGGMLWAAWLIGGLTNAAIALRQTRHSLPFRERSLQFGIATAVAGALLHALVDFPLQIASIQLYFGALLALFWGQRQREVTEKIPQPKFAPVEENLNFSAGTTGQQAHGLP